MVKRGKTLVICTEGAAYRDIINAGVLEKLLEKTEVVLVCADWMVDFLKKKFPRLHLEIVYKPSTYEDTIDHIRMTRTIYPSAAYPGVNTSSLKIKRDRDIQKNPFRYYSRRTLALMLKSEALQSFLRSLSWMTKKTAVRDLFKKYDIEKVFSTNMITLDHMPYVEYALMNKIPVITFIRSWDNLTSKGVPMYMPDLFLVWAPKQIEECTHIHHIPKKIVHAVGAPQFDPYFKNEVPSKEELYKRLKIPADATVITYVGGIPQNVMGLTTENEKVIVDTILNGIDSKQLPSNTIVVIRPHPGVKNWKQYHNFEKHKHVRMNYPEWYLTGKEPPKSWNPNWDDHLFMGSLMKFSSVVITPGGSSTLDAACFDTPSVNVYFDNPPRPYLESLRSHCDFDHLRYIREYKASPFAQTTGELLQEVKEGLSNPKKYALGRKELLKMIVGPTDGKTAERIVKEIISSK